MLPDYFGLTRQHGINLLYAHNALGIVAARNPIGVPLQRLSRGNQPVVLLQLFPAERRRKESLFEDMKKAGIEPTEHVTPSKLWYDAKETVKALRADIPICQLDMFAKHDKGVCLDCMA